MRKVLKTEILNAQENQYLEFLQVETMRAGLNTVTTAIGGSIDLARFNWEDFKKDIREAATARDTNAKDGYKRPTEEQEKENEGSQGGGEKSKDRGAGPVGKVKGSAAEGTSGRTWINVHYASQHVFFGSFASWIYEHHIDQLYKASLNNGPWNMHLTIEANSFVKYIKTLQWWR